ncbi:hypothetical protein A0U94_04430 [Gluconobacter albidus]|nr:hypothetical protein A0U94_04430 [Gluconobacter albidus]
MRHGFPDLGQAEAYEAAFSDSPATTSNPKIMSSGAGHASAVSTGPQRQLPAALSARTAAYATTAHTATTLISHALASHALAAHILTIPPVTMMMVMPVIVPTAIVRAVTGCKRQGQSGPENHSKNFFHKILHYDCVDGHHARRNMAFSRTAR